MTERMTERECKQLVKLLEKFSEVRGDGELYYLSSGEQEIIKVVLRWVRWYANDVLGMEL